MSKSLKVVDIMTNNLIFHIIFLAVLLTGNNIYASTFLLRCMTTNMEEGTKIELSYTVLKENKWIDIVVCVSRRYRRSDGCTAGFLE